MLPSEVDEAMDREPMDPEAIALRPIGTGDDAFLHSGSR